MHRSGRVCDVRDPTGGSGTPALCFRRGRGTRDGYLRVSAELDESGLERLRRLFLGEFDGLRRLRLHFERRQPLEFRIRHLICIAVRTARPEQRVLVTGRLGGSARGRLTRSLSPFRCDCSCPALARNACPWGTEKGEPGGGRNELE